MDALQAALINAACFWARRWHFLAGDHSNNSNEYSTSMTMETEYFSSCPRESLGEVLGSKAAFA